MAQTHIDIQNRLAPLVSGAKVALTTIRNLERELMNARIALSEYEEAIADLDAGNEEAVTDALIQVDEHRAFLAGVEL